MNDQPAIYFRGRLVERLSLRSTPDRLILAESRLRQFIFLFTPVVSLFLIWIMLWYFTPHDQVIGELFLIVVIVAATILIIGLPILGLNNRLVISLFDNRTIYQKRFYLLPLREKLYQTDRIQFELTQVSAGVRETVNNGCLVESIAMIFPYVSIFIKHFEVNYVPKVGLVLYEEDQPPSVIFCWANDDIAPLAKKYEKLSVLLEEHYRLGRRF